MWKTSLFASDDFKVTSHLTLNLGLRWQVQSGWGVTGDLFGDYDPLLPNPADGGPTRAASSTVGRATPNMEDREPCNNPKHRL